MNFIFRIILFLSLFIYANGAKKVSIQLQWKHQFEFAGFYIAKEKGFYSQAGLDVDIKEFGPGIDSVDDVIKGKTTFATSYPTIILDKSKGKDIVLLNAILQSSPHILVSLSSSGIKNIKDFEGKRIMINSDASNSASFISMLSSKGISIDKDMKPLKHRFRIDDLINGNTDLITSFSSNEPFVLNQKGIKYDIWDPKDYGFDFYDVILFTSKKVLDNDPEMVESFTKATFKGWRYAFENIDETAELILQKYNTQKKSKEALIYEAKILKELAYANGKDIGDIQKSKIQRIYDIYNLLGLTKNRINLDEFIYNDKNIYLTSKEIDYLKGKKEITFCVDPDWMPYEKIKNGNYIGIGSDYIKLFEERLNIKFKLIPTKNWKESKLKAKNRLCEVLPFSSNSQKRKEFMLITEPYLKEPLVLATKLDTKFITNLKQLKDKKIGITKEYSFYKTLKEKYPYLNIVETKDISDGLNKVAGGELFGQIDALSSINYYINEYFWGQLKISSKLDDIYNLCIASNSDDLILHNILKKAAKNISQDEHNAIYKKWNTRNKIVEKIDFGFIFQIILAVVVLLIFVLYRDYLLRTSNDRLKKVVEEKTKELILLNQNLEKKVNEEVEKNRKSEIQLLEQAKMAALGDMIGNIAHQWRQPLNVIRTAASGVGMHKELGILTDEMLKESLNIIDERSKYLSETIDIFRDFIREKKTYQEIVIQDRINKALEVVSGTFKQNRIEIKNDIDYSNPIKMKLIVGDLVQVIINVLNNSKDVLLEKDIENAWVKLDLLKNNADTVTITIEDNGGGIADEIMPKIFEPYFTTKHQSQGTGLGLHMCHKIVANNLKGKIYAQNSESGAKIFIELPL